MSAVERVAPYTRIEFFFTEVQTGNVVYCEHSQDLVVERKTVPHYRRAGAAVEDCSELISPLTGWEDIPDPDINF